MGPMTGLATIVTVLHVNGAIHMRSRWLLRRHSPGSACACCRAAATSG